MSDGELPVALYSDAPALYDGIRRVIIDILISRGSLCTDASFVIIINVTLFIYRIIYMPDSLRRAGFCFKQLGWITFEYI